MAVNVAFKDELMSADQVSRFYDVPITHVYRAVKEGKVPFEKVGRGLVFRWSQLPTVWPYKK